jgi:nucleoside 2-deoxyribosyltransferase
VALAALGPVELHTYIGAGDSRALQALANAAGVTVRAASPIKRTCSFFYFHPLSVPVIAPSHIERHESLVVKGDVVLRFGMLEGDAIVHGQRVIYDPQSANAPQTFSENGSTAESLAVVLNRQELHLLTGESDISNGATLLMHLEKADVIVVKRGGEGALVVDSSGLVNHVPAYHSELVFSIGSGDMFAAAFAAYWGNDRKSPVDAADLASRATALYCESRSPGLSPASALMELQLRKAAVRPGKVYLAAPFFSLGERWLVEEARVALFNAGLEVFSPLHDVGTGPGTIVASEDLAGLEKCNRMLALADGADTGTVFEIGYARAAKLPVVVYTRTLSDEGLKMIVGSNCHVIDDFTTAIYHTAWLPWPTGA